MTVLYDWAAKWGVSVDALRDLQVRLGMEARVFAQRAPSDDATPGSEKLVHSRLLLEAAAKGVLLMRNNVGALLDDRGVPVRYGLMNESKQMNARIKSSDVIGIRPVLIGPEHVGHRIGQFVAREEKHEGWVYRGDAHETAQKRFIDLVLSYGGDAAFTNGSEPL